MTSGPRVRAVVFDLGGVLVDWNPRHLYRALFGPENGGEAAMEQFLATVCTQAWNEEQDAGRPFAEAVALLRGQHPEHAALIEAFDRDWERMLGGAIEETVAILARLREAGVPLYALSNWSAEKFPIARRRFEFLAWFAGIVVSGEIGMKKPDPRIFQHLTDRFALTPQATLFIDDSAVNVEAARALGFEALRFETPARLASDLKALGLALLDE